MDGVTRLEDIRREFRDEAAEPGGILERSAWLLILLIAIHTYNCTDRYLVSILIEPLKRDIHISDSQVGLITGGGLLLVYALTALPIARPVDHEPRRRIFASLIGLWSTATWPPLRPACRPS